jgi:predicted esterase
MRSRLFLSIPLLFLLPSLTWAQRKEALIVFKDGFYLSGKVVEKRDFILDPSGVSVTIPLSGSLINLDDMVRRMYFIPGQLQEVLEKKQIERDLMVLKRYANTSRADAILPGWQVESFSPWNAKWERSLKVHVTRKDGNRYLNMDQRIVQVTPHFMHIQTLKYNWDLFHLTKEMGVEGMRPLLSSYFAEKKEIKDWDRRKLIAMFMHQAGWHKEAQKELDNLVEEYPSRKDDVAGLRATVKKVLADIFVEDIERAFKAGQHHEVQDRLKAYAKENMAPLVNEKNLLLAQDLKNKYENLSEKLGQAKTVLSALPKQMSSATRTPWANVAELILDELNYDTLGRLDTFLVFAEQHLREVKEKTKPTQSPEQVMALAALGWLLGNGSAEPDVKNAQNLLRARAMVLEYQKTDNTVQRNQLLTSVLRDTNLSLDALARIIKNLPPPYPYDKTKIGTEPLRLSIELADSRGGDYYLQLPPDYHHQRSYPVLLVLHGARERADGLMGRMSDLAAQHGFILAAPLWAGNGRNVTYDYTAKEHAVVLDTLRDLRRRFQVDSDRVFLFGWEQGADAVLDIGMSHPDQFAGALSMCGSPRFFTAERDRYQTNAQYLPFYLVDGDRDGANPKAIAAIFKEWVRGIYPALYVEYKGRGSEWFQGELPTMFDWMSRKKRHHPMKEMGRRHTGGGVGEEFRTMRECDNRFYWLSTEAIDPHHLNTASNWVRTVAPATLQANVAVGNELIVKGGQKEAKIFTQFNIQAKHFKQLTLWLAPNVVDLSKPIRIRVNGSQVGSERIIPPNPSVLMEDFFYNGDRQRLYFAKVDLKF